jgi:hypothetical protein
MKKNIAVWTLRIIVVTILSIGFLIFIVLKPSLLYANKTVIDNFTIYHTKPLDKEIKSEVDEAASLLKASELYNPNFKIDVCLNDGSNYPTLIQALHSKAFGIGFYNKVIIMGNINIKENYTEISGYKYNLAQLLAHESIHCLQFNKLGLWKSNPIGKIPDWKNDGYPEYIARKDQANLIKNITHLNEAIKEDYNEWGISFADSTYVGKEYYSWWVLTQYCMDVKKMTYKKILLDTAKEENLRKQMMEWYSKQYKR